MTETPRTSGWFSEDAATLGDRIAGAREHAGLTRAELAQRIGIRTETLRGWENDRNEPRANRLQMMAGMLGVTLAWLLTGRGAGPDAPFEAAQDGPDVLAALADLRQLSAEIAALAERTGRIEKRLRAAQGGRA